MLVFYASEARFISKIHDFEHTLGRIGVNTVLLTLNILRSFRNLNNRQIKKYKKKHLISHLLIAQFYTVTCAMQKLSHNSGNNAPRSTFAYNLNLNDPIVFTEVSCRAQKWIRHTCFCKISVKALKLLLLLFH